MAEFGHFLSFRKRKRHNKQTFNVLVKWLSVVASGEQNERT
jgi:hypothetical protein